MLRYLTVLFVIASLTLLAGCMTASELLNLDNADAPAAQPTMTNAAPEATPEPTAEPVVMDLPAPAAAPIVIAGSGQVTSYSGENSCTAPAQEVRLTVNPDGAAQLYVAGPSFIDHFNCTASGTVEAWYVEGTTGVAESTIIFTSCNMTNFSAEGELSYAGGALNGAAVCFYSKGSAAGTRTFGVTMP